MPSKITRPPKSFDLQLFRPLSVAEQVADALERAIAEGLFPGELPGEISLAKTLRVSRPSLRGGLRILEKRGWLRVAKGCRTTLRKPPRPSPAQSKKRVVFLLPGPRWTLKGAAAPVLQQIAIGLVERGIGVEEWLLPTRASGMSVLREQLLAASNVLFVPLRATAAVQRLLESCGVPALVLGSCHEGVSLPSVDTDYHALGWHAAGQLASRGYRHCFVAMPRERAVGDDLMLLGLQEYATSHPRTGLAVSELLIHESIPLHWSRILTPRKNPSSPVALVACQADYAISAMLSLALEGKAPGRDIGVISAQDIPLFERLSPAIARYCTRPEAFVSKALRIISHLLEGEVPRRLRTLVMPDFLVGETLRERTSAVGGGG